MNLPLISIIIPAYNTEKYIEECIKSIINQTYQNWECIIIDDGSQDNTNSIIKNWTDLDSRISLYYQDNQGVSKARNLGIDAAKGKYMCFIDVDDWVEPNFLAFFIDNIQDSNTLIVQDIIKDYNSHTVVKTQDYINKEFLLPKELKEILSNYKFTQGYASNKLYNLSIIRKNNLYFHKNTANEDEIFYFKYLQYISKIKFIEEAQYHYIQRKLSISRTPKFIPTYNYLLKVISINNNIKNILEGDIENTVFAKQYSAKRFSQVFHFCFKNAIYTNNYSFKERMHYLKLLSNVLLSNIYLLQPAKTIPQKIDLFLLKNKLFLLTDLFIKLRKALN